MKQHDDTGFTLVEILIALALFGLVLLVIGQAFEAATRVFERQRAALTEQADFAALDNMLRRMIAQADAGSGLNGAFFVGRAHGFVFRAPMPAALDNRDDAQADIRLSVDATHRFVMIWTPYRHINGPPTLPQTRPLLEHVSEIECSYYSNGHWTTTWYGNKLPELLRLRMKFFEEGGRHWPDIVVAPRLNPAP